MHRNVSLEDLDATLEANRMPLENLQEGPFLVTLVVVRDFFLTLHGKTKPVGSL